MAVRRRLGAAVLAATLLTGGSATAAGTAPGGAGRAATLAPYRTTLAGGPVYDVAAAPDGSAYVLQGAARLARLDAAGAVDTGFGTGGSVALPTAAAALALTATGSVLVVGPDGVRRYDGTGAADATFAGGAGLASLPGATDLAVDGAGRIVVVAAGALARFTPDGLSDASFDGDGVLPLTTQGSGPRVAVDHRDRPIVLMRTGPVGTDRPLVLRATTAGAPDAAFDGDGLVTCECNARALALAVAADDGVLVAGPHEVTRLTSSGALDLAFGALGTTTFEDGVEVDDLVVLGSGDIAIAGRWHVAPFSLLEFPYLLAYVRRLDADGYSPCGGTRTTLTADPLDDAWWNASALAPDGSLLLGGTTGLGTAEVARQAVPDRPAPDTCPSRYTPRTPRRWVDTRIGQGAPRGALPSSGQLDVQVGGLDDIPSTAVAVTVTITVTNATDAGFVTAWPAGTERPTTSVLNVDATDHTVAGQATVPLGRHGAFSVFTQPATDLVVDVSGYWAAPSAAGGLKLLEPTRLIDTRNGTGIAPGRLRAGQTVEVPFAGTDGIPAWAVIGTVTATEAADDGFVAMWASRERPLVSNLNIAPGHIRSNQFVVPVDPFTGTFELYTHTDTHVVVDVTGYVPQGVTDPRAAVATDLRVVTPTRELDTRDGTGGITGPLPRGAVVKVAVGLPSNATKVSGVVATLTVVDATAPGFVTAWAGGPLPGVSSLNVDRRHQTRSIQITVPVADDNTVSLYVHAGGHVLLDVIGYLP